MNARLQVTAVTEGERGMTAIEARAADGSAARLQLRGLTAAVGQTLTVEVSVVPAKVTLPLKFSVQGKGGDMLAAVFSAAPTVGSRNVDDEMDALFGKGRTS